MSDDDISKIYEKLDSIDNRMMRVETVLIGVPDTDEKGLCGLVNEHVLELGKLKRLVYILIGILIGSGVIGGSAAAIIEAMK